ncbi:MAG TPA: transglycosylase SLT domain-containing protein [Gemmatimonadaceae bacterium]|nr:transglycosylase SLT domain-containing protein [Gemmatimonadaceae bacterium]
MVFAQLARLCFVVLCTEGQCPANAASSDSMVVVRTADSTVVAACDALAQRRAWRATRLLEPVLADQARRTPDVVLLAATAAAELQGWGEVARLLEPVSWIDTVQAGRGRVLLARAALERGLDSLARVYAEAAVGTARDVPERARRTVILARALDRLAVRDSARDAYVAAARGLPEIADWLYLRAAALTPRKQGREALYEALATAPAKARATRVEAQALESLGGDLAAAARAYEQAGLPVQGLRLRAMAAPNAGARTAVKRRLIAIVAESPGGQEARDAIAVLDERFPSLSGGEQLLVARSLAVSGPWARSATLFRRALAAGRGTVRDRYTYATVLRRLDRHREAIAQLSRITSPRPLAADAAFLRARSLLELDRDRQATRLLRAIPQRYPRDTAAAAGALYLLADLATDARRDAAARQTMLALAKRYPTSSLAAPARFRAALIAYIQRSPRTAAMELDTLIVRHGRSNEANAALYWAGRAWERAGNRQKSEARWRELLERDPLSYYAAQAARRLGSEPWAPPAMADAFPQVPVVDSSFRRADILMRLGMESEARLEYDHALHEAGESLPRLLATADAFRDRGLTTRSIQLGWKLIARGERDARTYRLIYPIALGDAIVAESRQRRVDPGLVAAIIRQESSFNPRATSGPGARGLMQVMPNVGEAIARSLRYPYWNADLLYEPDVNLQLGITHLRAMLGGRHVVRALAAYNAGDGRVARWSRKAGVDDPEIFVERIPFTETRDYVRIVLRNRDLYRALYGFPAE